MVHDVQSFLSRGVSLIEVPGVSISADQQQKVINRSSQSCGQIISIHLDEIKNTASMDEIIKRTLVLPKDAQESNLLFASPQAIVDKPRWKQFLKDFLTRKLSRLVDVENYFFIMECHFAISLPCYQISCSVI